MGYEALSKYRRILCIGTCNMPCGDGGLRYQKVDLKDEKVRDLLIWIT